MGATHKYTVAQVIEALEASAGIHTAAAQRLGCHVNTIKYHIKRNRAVAAAAAQQNDTIIDVAESVVIQRLNDKNDKHLQFAAAKFVLTTKGKDRGWGNSVDVNVKVEELVRQIVEETGDPEEIVRPFVIDFVGEKKRRSA